jgi:hypothetical protein
MSITNVEAVEDTSSPAFNSSSGFSLFGPSSPIAHETQFSSRRGSTPKGTEFSKRSPAKEEDPMNDPRVKATILDLQSKIREMEAELSRKEKELMEVSRKLAQTESKAQQTAAELEKMRGENTSLRLSPSKSADSNIEINFLRKDLDRAKAELQDARSENQALASSLRGRERAYDELQEVVCVIIVFRCVLVCLCLCLCLCLCVCACARACVYAYVRVRMCACVCARACVRAHSCIPAYESDLRPVCAHKLRPGNVRACVRSTGKGQGRNRGARSSARKSPTQARARLETQPAIISCAPVPAHHPNQFAGARTH